MADQVECLIRAVLWAAAMLGCSRLHVVNKQTCYLHMKSTATWTFEYSIFPSMCLTHSLSTKEWLAIQSAHDIECEYCGVWVSWTSREGYSSAQMATSLKDETLLERKCNKGWPRVQLLLLQDAGKVGLSCDKTHMVNTLLNKIPSAYVILSAK